MSPTKLLSNSVKGGATLLGAVGIGAIALLGAPKSAEAANVILGSDYLVTPGGGTTVFDFGDPDGPGGLDPIGEVSFKGVPLGGLLGNTDTIVERQANAIFDNDNDNIIDMTTAAPIPIEMTALSLMSEDPVNIGGTLFNAFVGLNPAAPSTGTMTITHNGAVGMPFDDSGDSQGTFDSVLDVSFITTFIDVNDPTNLFSVNDMVTMIVDGAPWSHVPPPKAVLVTDLTMPDGAQNSNCHLPAGSNSPCNEGDFFPGAGELVQHETPDDPFKHGVRVATTPEPSATVPLVLLGLTGLWGLRKKQSRK